MPCQVRSRPRASAAVRLAAVGGLVVAVRKLGPSFTLKGAWEGDVADVRSLPKGLEPSSIGGVAFSDGEDGGLKFTLEDGRLGMDYSSGPLALRLDDNRAWKATFSDDATNVKVTGVGQDDIAWVASKRGKVEGLGDVVVDANSNGEYDVFLERALPELGGMQLNALTRASKAGIQGRLEAQRNLAEGVDANYVVENYPGDYDLASLKHSVKLNAAVGGGSFGVDASSEGLDNLRYKASFDRDLSDMLEGSESAIALSADNGGFSGSFKASKEVANGHKASFSNTGRVGMDFANPDIAADLKLSSDFGSLSAAYQKGGAIAAAADLDVDQAGFNAKAKVGYALGDDLPSYNVSLSRDLSEVLQSDGMMQVGVDSDEGVYGRLAGSRDLGNGFGAEFYTAGRPAMMEHAIMLANKLGYAQVVKKTDADARLRLGYQFDM